MKSLAMVMIPVMLLGACATTSASKRDQLKREILQELRAEQTGQEDATTATSLAEGQVPRGSVEGRFLWRGEPLQRCRVRLVMIEVQGNSFGRNYAQTASIETETDTDGVYRFEGVPIGPYKIKWVPPGGDSWIRFLSTEPDLTVKPGATVRFRDIEAAKRALGA